MLTTEEVIVQPDTQLAVGSAQFGLHVEETAEAILLSGAGYSLRIFREAPLAELRLNGRLVTTLHLAPGLDTLDAVDEETVLGAPALTRELDAWVVTWQGQSACWT